MRRNPKIVSLDPPTSAAAGLTRNPPPLTEVIEAMHEAPGFLRSLGYQSAYDLDDHRLASGGFARVFRVPSGGKVLKLTLDADDARLAELASREGPIDGIVRIHEVYRLPTKVMTGVHAHDLPRQTLYAIVADEVRPLARPQDDWRELEGDEEQLWIAANSVAMATVPMTGLGRGAELLPKQDVIRDALQRADRSGGDERAEGYVRSLVEGWYWMAEHGARYNDLRRPNVGFDPSGRAVILDLGLAMGGDPSHEHIPLAANPGQLQPNTPADLWQIEEAVAKTPQLMSMLGFPRGADIKDYKIARGAWAQVFATPAGDVLKFTTDGTEAETAAALVEEAPDVRGLARVKHVYKMPYEVLQRGEGRPLYALVVERVVPLAGIPEDLKGIGEEEKQALERIFPAVRNLMLQEPYATEADLQQKLAIEVRSWDLGPLSEQYLRDLMSGWWWLHARGLSTRDIHWGNVGWDRNGSVVLLDFGGRDWYGVPDEGFDLALASNPSPKVDDVFDEAFDVLEEKFPDFGTIEFFEDEKAGADNGAGSERQFAYCEDGHPIAIAFAPKAARLPKAQLVGLMRHEMGHALEYRFGVKELERRLGRKLPDMVERRADAIAEAVWGEPIVYDEKLVQCVGVPGVRPRPAHLPDERAKLKANPSSRMRAYKSMRFEGGRAISGADSRQGFVPRRGDVIRMPGRGIFVSTNRDYIETYYAGHNPQEVLLTLEFDVDDIVSGAHTLGDREPELTLRQAEIVDFEVVRHDDLEENAPGAMRSLRRALTPNASPAMTPIEIDRDRTLEQGASAGIVARFSESVPLYRAIDGEELAIAFSTGRFDGGVFATPSERAFGASWAAGSALDVAEWAAGWAKRGRLGKDLFVVVADGRGHTFFREGAQREGGVPFDPEGPAVQRVVMPLSVCNTGLGCSASVAFDERVRVMRVGPDGSLEPMTRADVERYVRSHPVPDVNLRNFGFGSEWYGGSILGHAVIVGEDFEDGLWVVKDRNERPFVIGARSKDAAIREAKKMISAGRMHETSRLNRVPPGFDKVSVGDRFKAKGYPRFEGTVQQLGASYVMLRGRRPGDEYDDHLLVKAPELMRRWEHVGGALRPNPAGDDVVLPRGSLLFHGTLEGFEGGLRPGGDGVVWFADTPAIAQLYIPCSGGSMMTSVDSLARPSKDPTVQAIQATIGIDYDLDDTRFDYMDRPVSFPAPRGWSHLPTAQDVTRLLSEWGATVSARGSVEVNLSYGPGGVVTLAAPGECFEGRLYIARTRRDMRIYVMSEGEGDLTDVQYNKLEAFRELERRGYDGVLIDDFAQSDHWGNLGHLSVGLFASAVRDVDLDSVVAQYREFEMGQTGTTDYPEGAESYFERLRRGES